MKNKLPEVDYELPDETRALIESYADQKERGWVGVAQTVENILDDAEAEGVRVNKTKLYADVADCYRCGPSTIAQYASVYERAWDFVDVYSFQDYGFEQWRLLLALAKHNGRELKAELEVWEASRDDYGGKPAPVRVLRAALAGNGRPQDPMTPLDRARRRLESAAAAVDRALRLDAGATPADREAWSTVRAVVADWVAGAEPEPAAGPHGVSDWRRAA